MKPGNPVDRLLFLLPDVSLLKRAVLSSGTSVSPIVCRIAGVGKELDDLRGGLDGEAGFVVSSSSSPHISSASVKRTVFRVLRVAPSMLSIFVFGVMGSLFRSAWCEAPMAASSSAASESSEYSSLSVSSTNPNPGARALFATAGCVCSSDSRQERASTPDNKMTVPRAIRPPLRGDNRLVW